MYGSYVYSTRVYIYTRRDGCYFLTSVILLSCSKGDYIIPPN